MDTVRHVRRLIEVDLPVRVISGHARREKSIRDGHISTLHVWWARRPLAACRAVILASLWPDPCDPGCPERFLAGAAKALSEFHARRTGKSSNLASPEGLRTALLEFIGDFASWEASNNLDFITTCRSITASAATAADINGRPVVLDPFAGGGSIPLEALRVGAEAVATDFNPIPVLLNRVLVDFIPKFGQALADDLVEAARDVQRRAEVRLMHYFPFSQPGRPPVAYLWARQIRCEGPGCGLDVPVIRSLTLAKKGKSSVGLEVGHDKKANTITVSVVAGKATFGSGTVKRGSVSCPACGYTTPVARVREQMRQNDGGADTSRLLAVVCRTSGGKTYHAPTETDLEAVGKCLKTLKRVEALAPQELPLMSGVFNAPIYGMTRWDLLFSARQLLVAQVLGEEIDAVVKERGGAGQAAERALAVKILLLLVRGKYLDFRSTLCGWISVGEKIGHTFGRQALGMIFDWSEGTPFGDMSGSWGRSYEAVADLIRREGAVLRAGGTAVRADAQHHPLPDDSVAAVITDPPYYNAVPYADLSDFFYLWLRPHLVSDLPDLFASPTAPKAQELCEMKGWDPIRYPEKDAEFYERGMRKALEEARRVCRPDGIAVIVFAHKTTAGWETLLGALVDAGWVVTGSWPIDTERAGRLRAMRSAALGSSVHLVCRPRELANGQRDDDSIGDWRSVLEELPQRIREWLPRLAAEGVVGADAIFACLGPALEVFSRYARVEKVSGERVALREYLEHVWAVVSREALRVILDDAETSGLEPDARLTAMWLWTLVAPRTVDPTDDTPDDEEPSGGAEDDEEGSKALTTGYVLEFDAGRKIAQGLGAKLEELSHVVQIKGDKARLLPVIERAKHLFGKAEGVPTAKKVAKKKQLSMFADLDEAADEQGWGDFGAPRAGTTTLDRIHQAMLLFASGRGEALKRFLVEDGVGKQPQFWKLAQSLSALYPSGAEEKRWVDGVLARKKGLGFG